MPVPAGLRSAVRTDTGLRRTNNEDRYYVDAARGIFAVIDGVGGQAAGEHAAELAVTVLRERLERETGTPGERLREAIALANNEIYRQAQSRPDWAGMACVLTVALVEDGLVTVGHVGDSRLYLLRPGEIRKITHDHSPVGEREDRGEITEEEAMRHPRRNEIFRDVGSMEREPDDPAFIEITEFPMPEDGAILICSDGLTDLIGSPWILAGVERHAPSLDAAIGALIDSANHAGGKDNITIVVVASAGYMASKGEVSRKGNTWMVPVLALVAGIALGLLIPFVQTRLASQGPQIIVATAGIGAALAQARPGDTVLIPQGAYREKIVLREGVALRAQLPATVTLTSPDGDAPVLARGIDAGSLEGVWIRSDPEKPARAGIRIVDAAPAISNVRITGMRTGIEIEGASTASITASRIENNLGAGIVVGSGAKPRIGENLIAANGNGKPGEPKPGLEIAEGARPLLKDNAIVNNAAEPVWVRGHVYQLADLVENFFGELPARRAIRMTDEPPPAAEAAKPKPRPRPAAVPDH